MIVSLVANALKAAAIPNIDGVSVGVPDTDRSKWEVQWLPAATTAHKAAAATVLAGVVIDAATDLDFVQTSDIDDKKLKAIVLGLWEAIPGPLLTKAALRARIIQIYKGL